MGPDLSGKLSAATALQLGIDDQVEPLVLRRRREVAGEEIEIGFAGREDVRAVLVSLPQARLADRIRYIEVVQLVGRAGALEEAAHPSAPLGRVGREVQDHGKTGA